MEYKIIKGIFEINIMDPKKIINTTIIFTTLNNIYIYKIIKFLGSGTNGNVYLIYLYKDDIYINKFVIKIANPKNSNDLLDELLNISECFKNNNIKHSSYPLYYGTINNSEQLAIIYLYLGYYDLDYIKKTNNIISYDDNINIIQQILDQLKSLNNIIHCDLKPANIVIDIKPDTIVANIIDFGLVYDLSTKQPILSTSYITSPESLLTLDKYKNCINKDEKLDLSKHDYCGLFTIIVNLFIKKNIFEVIIDYLTIFCNIQFDNIKIDSGIHIFVYMWYKFSYSSNKEIKNKSLFNLINNIEKNYPYILTVNFLNFNDFFNDFILLDLNYNLKKDTIISLKKILKEIIHFESVYRPTIDELIKSIKSDLILPLVPFH